MLCTVCFSNPCLNTDFVGNTNTIYICLILYTFTVFFPMGGCVGMGPGALLFPGARNTAKTALLLLLSSKKQYRFLHMYNATVTLLFRYFSR